MSFGTYTCINWIRSLPWVRFPDELHQAPRSWAERAYPDNLIHYNRPDRGGHFAAWEHPQLLAEELRASFRSLR